MAELSTFSRVIDDSDVLLDEGFELALRFSISELEPDVNTIPSTKEACSIKILLSSLA